MTASKHLLSEIDTLRREQQQKRISLNSNPASTPCLRPRHQFEMQIDDFGVLFDVLKLTFLFLDRATMPYTSKERSAIEVTLRRIVPLVFNIDEKLMESSLAPAIVFEPDGDSLECADSDDEAIAMSDTAASGSDGSSVHGRWSAKKTAADLRKKLLATTVNGINETVLQSKERAAEDLPDKEASKNGLLPELDIDTWITASPVPWPTESTPAPSIPPKIKRIPLQSPTAGESLSETVGEASETNTVRYNFFGSKPFYCFIKLFHVRMPIK